MQRALLASQHIKTKSALDIGKRMWQMVLVGLAVRVELVLTRSRRTPRPSKPPPCQLEPTSEPSKAQLSPCIRAMAHRLP